MCTDFSVKLLIVRGYGYYTANKFVVRPAWVLTGIGAWRRLH